MNGFPQRLRYFVAIFALCLMLAGSWLVLATGKEPITVSLLLHAPEAAEWKPFVEQFHRSHPQIRLNIVEGPNATNQLEDLYTASFLLGNSPYDLVYMDIVWVSKFAAAGWLRDLSDRLSASQLSTFLTGDLQGSYYQGKLYRIPTRSDAGMLYYRSDLLKQAGYSPPTTFQELLEISQALQTAKMVDWGYLWQGKQYEGLAAMFVEVIAGYGGFWLDPNTLEVGLDQPAALQAVEFLRDTLQTNVSPPGVTTYAEEEVRRLFQNGKAAFMRNWPYAVSLASQSDSPIRGKFDIQPMVSQAGDKSGACQGGWGLGIAASSQHPDEAWQVIEFFTSEAFQREFVLATGKVPSLKSLYHDPQITAKYPHYPQLYQVLQEAALRPPIAQYAQASDILQRYLSAALTGRLTPEKAMQAATDETRRLFNQGNRE